MLRELCGRLRLLGRMLPLRFLAAPPARRPGSARGRRCWRLPARAGLRPHPGVATRARPPAVRPRRAVRRAAARSAASASWSSSVCRVAVASASVAASSASRRVSRSAAAAAPGRPVLLRPVRCASSASAHLLRERIAGRRTLRHLSVVLCVTLRELGSRRRHLGRMPPLRFLERRLRVGQVLREDVAVGDFLSEPDFDLTVALRRLRGRLLFGRRRAVRRAAARSRRRPAGARACAGSRSPLQAWLASSVSRRESRSAAAAAPAAQSCRARSMCLFGSAQLLRERHRGPPHSAPPQRRTVRDAPRVGQPPSSSGTHAAAPLPSSAACASARFCARMPRLATS